VLKQTKEQISSLFKDDRHPVLHFLYESQAQVITALQSKYVETTSPYKIGQIKAAVQMVLSLPSALLENLEGFVYRDLSEKKKMHIWVPFPRTRWTLKVKSGGQMEL
jgi:hypothetical protein